MTKFLKLVLSIACALGMALPATAGNIAITNGGLDQPPDKQEEPRHWTVWTHDHNHISTDVSRSEPYSWKFWNDSGIYQDIVIAPSEDLAVRFGGYLYMPRADPLRGGTKRGRIELEFYSDPNGAELIENASSLPSVTEGMDTDAWIYSYGIAAVPPNARLIRITVRCDDGLTGEGVFYADDLFVEEYGR